MSPGSERDIEEKLGMSRGAQQRAKRHVALAEQYPFMQRPGWLQHHVFALGKLLMQLPDAKRVACAAAIDADALQPDEAIRWLREYFAGTSAVRRPRLSRTVFSRDRDDWETPHELYAQLDAEFHFTTDAAATRATAKCAVYFGPDNPAVPDALAITWPVGRYYLNPPYSRVKAFIPKAAEAAALGSIVVCLVAARTDTRWWHETVYDSERWRLRPGVQVRFIKRRVHFVGAKSGAPFPSVVVVFEPPPRGAVSENGAHAPRPPAPRSR